MVAVVAFIDREGAGIMVVLSDFGGQLGLFAGMIDNFMIIAYPAALGLVYLVRV